mmetsp:Transcript_13614/g.18259  ORF Transcript_13614/g.18259 Transcript_13614/m.18259 type:complete len:107 (-) Transcript_13614:549-869(-)
MTNDTSNNHNLHAADSGAILCLQKEHFHFGCLKCICTRVEFNHYCAAERVIILSLSDISPLSNLLWISLIDPRKTSSHSLSIMTGPFLVPSNSMSIPFFTTKAMKW